MYNIYSSKKMLVAKALYDPKTLIFERFMRVPEAIIINPLLIIICIHTNYRLPTYLPKSREEHVLTDNMLILSKETKINNIFQ